MKNKAVTEYAEALFILASEENAANEYYNDLTVIKAVFEKNPEYVSLLSSPSLTIKERTEAIRSAFSTHVRENTLSFLMLLCEKRHIKNFGTCFNDFEKLYNASKRVVIAHITSAVPLTEDEKKGLSAQLEEKRGASVELVCEVDKSILGGIIIKTEDTVIDGSLKSKLRGAREAISR